MTSQSNLSDKSESAIRAGRTSLAAYAAGVDPGYILADHLVLLIDALERVERGEIKRLMIFMPPRHGKTQTVSRIFPAWFLGKNPNKRILAAGHTQSFATTEFAWHVFQNINNPIHAAVFPEFELSDDAAAKANWKTKKEGAYFCAGLDAGFTGRGADIFIIDDPIKTAADAMSIVKRTSMKAWYQSVARTRLEPNAAIIIVQTRWHEDDLSGWLLNKDEHEELDDWWVLSLPAISEEDEEWRPENAALWPARYPLKELESIKRKSDQRVWWAMYQQRPSAIEGYMCKRSWFKEYIWDPHKATDRNLIQVMTKPYRITASIDVALEEGKENDYSVIGIYLEILSTGNHYKLDTFRQKVISTELFRLAKELCIYWQVTAVLIEDTSVSKAFCQQMETTELPIIRCPPEGGKEIRFQAVTPWIQAGKLWLPRFAAWREPYINELCAFPTAAHDDQVDETSQYLHWASMNRYRKGRELEQDAVSDDDFNPFEM